jgi:hypothetical protein
MAVNKPKGDNARKGAVKKRTQLKNPLTKISTKRNKKGGSPPPHGSPNAVRRSVYLASREFEKRANSAAGPGYISTHPACRSELSVNPPQSTPMVAIFVLPAASAS